MDLISKETRGAFREHLVSWTLRTISNLFAKDIPRGQPTGLVDGARRSLVSDYYAGIDWTSAKDIRKVVKVYERILNSIDPEDGDPVPAPYETRQLRKLTNLLRRDGYIYENRRLLTTSRMDLAGIPEATTLVDARTLHEHLERIAESVGADSSQAVGSAKELVETVAKHILIHYGQDPEQYDTIQQLVKHALKCLDLSLENIPEAKKGAESIKQVLAGLAQIVGGTAELRNLYGTGHGRTRRGGLEPRHARLVVGATATLTRFLLETLDIRKKEPPK
jgi:hypothetical protein